MRLVLVFAVCSVVLSGCATAPRDAQSSLTNSRTPLPLFNDVLFEPTAVISQEAVSYINDEQRAKFFKFLNNPNFAATPRHERVATYMGLLLDQFTFTDKTYTAQQSLATKSGNCLSLTMLTTAYAELADVKVTYQLLDQNPIYNIDSDNLLVTSDHLRAVLHSPPLLRQLGSILSVSKIRIDYFQTDGLSYVSNVSTDMQLSLFYSNLAVENLSNNDLDSAYTYAERALQIYAHNASALNTMGIVHRKRGDLARAETIFLHGVRHFDKAPTFLRNYTALLKSQSREVDLSLVGPSMATNSYDHPWQWVRAGKAAYNNGNYDQAVSYYQRALVLAPDIHQLHLLAGTASYAAGDKEKSHRHLSQALALATESSDRSGYKRKLEAFQY